MNDERRPDSGPQVCVSVVSHGQGALAAKLLKCLEAHSAGSVAQLIVTRNIPEAWTPIASGTGSLVTPVVIDNPAPLGFGANHNQAFAKCEAPYFCVLNPDIEWSEDPFPPLRRFIEEQSERPIGLAAPLVLSPSGNVENTARALYTPAEVYRQKRNPRNHGERPAWLAGMFLMFHSRAFRSIGGFDERYRLYIEDVDISTRLALSGWALRQCAESTVVHNAQYQSHRSLRYASWHIAGMLRYWTSPGFRAYAAQLRKKHIAYCEGS